jgi:hypothetical protein
VLLMQAQRGGTSRFLRVAALVAAASVGMAGQASAQTASARPKPFTASPNALADGGGTVTRSDDPHAVSSPIQYLDDGHIAHTCNGRSSALDYMVYYPTTPGPHPIVFATKGSGFQGNAGCVGGKHPDYEGEAAIMESWAAAGYVAVNIEYHGYQNGLYGDLSYPGQGKWENSDVADGSVQIDVKPAVEYFLSHNPSQYGANPSAGMIAFGGSSGGHDAYMLGLTGIPGYKFAAVIGWSGEPDAAALNDWMAYTTKYMRTSRGSDVANFGDPEHRISQNSPAEYIANGTREFVTVANAEDYYATCVKIGVKTCWERILNTSEHAEAYVDYKFTNKAPEITKPTALKGNTVMNDSIEFANSVLGRS